MMRHGRMSTTGMNNLKYDKTMATIYKIGSPKSEVVKQIQRALNLFPDGIYGPFTAERVKSFQREHSLTPDGIVGPATLALLLPSVTASVMGLKRSKRRITKIIVHCTATPEGRHYTVDDIRKWHRQRGFSDIGYHYVVYLDGSVHLGRDVDISGAHCTNHNSNSIGICYVGGVAMDGKTPKDTRTKEQKAALMSLLKDLRRMYPEACIHSHSDYANKACPSFDATYEYRNI